MSNINILSKVDVDIIDSDSPYSIPKIKIDPSEPRDSPPGGAFNALRSDPKAVDWKPYTMGRKARNESEKRPFEHIYL